MNVVKEINDTIRSRKEELILIEKIKEVIQTSERISKFPHGDIQISIYPDEDDDIQIKGTRRAYGVDISNDLLIPLHYTDDLTSALEDEEWIQKLENFILFLFGKELNIDSYLRITL